MKRKVRPLTLFYVLIAYVLFQLMWWGQLLIQAQPNKTSMVIGEFSVFVIILFWGAFSLKRLIQEEIALNRRQKNFLLSVTHELKSPLASIKLYLQTILKRDLDKEKQQGFIRNSLLDIERLDDLVENMLMATKIENNSYSYPKENFDLSEAVQQVVERHQNILQKRIVKSDITPDILIRGDRFTLLLVVSNLLENAVKYSAEGTEINIELFKKNNRVILKVNDQGVGIPDEEKPKIFDKFYRIGQEDTRKTKGTGLGLFIVKQVLDNHGATIKVRNNQPVGSEFEVTF
ncbi:sensor histidine kinase [Solitalea canadensis]|uniref:histidine kinase n=1 Tax=Solitalea canadensis (strain ATCC 29591 / DSM 3403 / JCM 21819 / LMG 8368 / NBRC 15130 / NCIMB 12057 / USAM 9D) TaxID=929556 RepID=H8KS46_SOLCM|nr:HAMP domain-containing sensor histidine kinase [Solitalea canadensis]AFD07834.1 histidine kinase [Solitalea canadensis DSM 3403]